MEKSSVLHNDQLTNFFTSGSNVIPQSFFSLADLRTDKEICAAWETSPLLRNPSSGLPSPSTKLFNLFATSSDDERQGSRSAAGLTCS